MGFLFCFILFFFFGWEACKAQCGRAIPAAPQTLPGGWDFAVTICQSFSMTHNQSCLQKPVKNCGTSPSGLRQDRPLWYLKQEEKSSPVEALGGLWEEKRPAGSHYSFCRLMVGRALGLVFL